MAARPTLPSLPPELRAYLLTHSDGVDDVMRDLIAETEGLAQRRMMLAPESALLLGVLVRLIGARVAVEVGTFTGLSALAVARALPPDGRLLCCDINEEWTAIARRYWERAGVAGRIELRIGPGLAALAALPEEPHVDFAFVDADKDSYAAYHDALVPRLRPGGLLVVDNVLWNGRVLDPETDDAATVAIRCFNERAAADERTDTLVLPVGDGLSIQRRRTD